MKETIFPPSPSWFLPNNIAAREDGTISYGSKSNIVILRSRQNESPEMSIIQNAHGQKVTAVAFSPSNCFELVQNTIVSCSEDGFVKLWKIDTLTATIGHKSHWEQKGDIGKIVSLDWSIANPCFVVSAAENNTLVLWDILSNSTVKFSFQKNLATTVISCCPYNEKIVAIGGKTGQIHIISLAGKGEILYKLRGHDNKIHSLSWCTVPYNVFRADEICEEFLLASACQNKEIFIWRAGSDGKCEAKFQLPTYSLNKKDNLYCGKVGNTFSYSAILWFEPYKLYSSSNFGELIYFDIKSYTSNKDLNGTSKGQKLNKLSFIKLGHCFHMKGLFGMAASPVKPEIWLYKGLQMKSELKFTNQSNYKIIEKFENESETDRLWEAIMPDTPSLLWTAGQDRKLVACKLKSSQLEIVSHYHTVNGFVYCAVVSPHDPNRIAIGVGDGMIRLWNLTDPENVQIYWQKIKDRVMSLAWHPIKDGFLAYGTSEGRVGLIDTNSNKLPSVFKPSHPHPIYSLSWGPLCTLHDAKDSSSKSEFDLYAVADNTLSLYRPSKLSEDPLNLSEIIPFPCKSQTDICWKPDYSLMAVGNEDGSICLIEPSDFKIVYTLQAYKKLIKSLVWHPTSTSLDSGVSSYHGYFTSGSTDNSLEIRVFNCKKEEKEIKVEQVATLKGHCGHIMSVSWSPHISGRLISTSADFSVQIWDVISQTPLVNFTASGMPLFSLYSPIDPDFILTGCKNDVLHVWKASAQTKISPSSKNKTKKQKKEKALRMSTLNENTTGDIKITEDIKQTEDRVLEMAETAVTTKNTKELKMFSKAWKGDVDEILKTCYSLLKSEEEADDEGIYSLQFLNNDFEEMVSAEEETLKKSNNQTEFYELALWNGNIKEVLEEKIKSGQLNDFLVSVAPVVSPGVWQEACISYSKTLCEKKMYRKAASYLLVCHKIYEAIQLLMNANLYLEALCIARSRLPKSDPILKSIVREYALWLCKNGSCLKACECFIYLKDYLGVTKICGKKKQPEFLHLAALAAKKCGSDLEYLEATNAIFTCFKKENFELAQRICSDHANLKHLGLLLCIYLTIHQLDIGELKLEKDILSHIKDSFDVQSVVYPDFLPTLFHRYSLYNSRHQVLTITTQELCFALCSRGNEEILTHLIKALSTCHQYKEEQLPFKLCSWLSPQGFQTENSIFSLKNSSPKAKSLRAFLCAAIIKHLNYIKDTDENLNYLIILKELKEDLLDIETLKYYKNILESKIREEKLLKHYNKLSRSASTDETNSDEDKCINLTIISSKKPEDEILNNGTVSEKQEELEMVSENDSDLVLLKSLKNEIENYENIRICAPCPLFFYNELKKLYEGIPENKMVKIFLEDLEKKWKEIN